MAIFGELKKHYPNIKDLIESFATLGDDILFEEMKYVKIRGHLTQTEFERICIWKSARPTSKYKQNIEADIISITEKAILCADEGKKIDLLIKLKGVAIATASAILTAIEPENYGVIDIRVWQILYHYNKVSTSKSSNFTVGQWLMYLKAMRNFAEEYKMPVRKIEAALFLASQRNQIGNLYP